jgi:hypothetical protein
MFYTKTYFYYKVDEWVKSNPTHTFYLYASQQSDKNIYDFCLCVLDNNKIPVIITHVGGFDTHYPISLKQSMNLSDDVRVYEVAKMGLDIVLNSKANKFIETNGGILWIQ